MSKLRNNQSGFGTVEGVLVLVIVVLIGVIGYLVYKNHNKTIVTSATTNSTPSTTITPQTPTPPKTLLSGDFGDSGDYGMFQAEGYAQTVKVDNVEANCGMANPGVACPKMDEIFFTITKTNNSHILAFLKELQYTGIPDKSLAIGCSAGDAIKYSNSSDNQQFKNYTLTKEDTAKILATTVDKQIRLEITKLKFTGGKDAPNCYSPFSTYKIINT